MPGMYARVWEYDVPVSSLDAFVAAYGPDGAWARLFARGPGFLGTELFRSTDLALRFLTVDRWADEEAWQTFLRSHRAAYDALDAELTVVGAHEWPLLDGVSAEHLP